MVHGGWRVSQRSLAVAVHGGDASRCVAHLAEVQDVLGGAYVIENPSTYVSLATSTMTELEFLHALVNATGCRLLCDVSNVHLSGHNMGYDAYRYIDEFPAGAVAELHLGGFTPEDDEATPGGTLLVDTHANAVADPRGSSAAAIRRFGPQPTIVEWDNDLPTLAVLIEEAAKADRVRDCGRGSPCSRWLTSRPAFAMPSSTETARVVPVLVGGTRPEHRLAIHQRHYVASLTRALVERFPATVWLVGSELVTHVATSFVREHPPSRCIADTATVSSIPRRASRC